MEQLHRTFKVLNKAVWNGEIGHCSGPEHPLAAVAQPHPLPQNHGPPQGLRPRGRPSPGCCPAPLGPHLAQLAGNTKDTAGCTPVSLGKTAPDLQPQGFRAPCCGTADRRGRASHRGACPPTRGATPSPGPQATSMQPSGRCQGHVSRGTLLGAGVTGSVGQTALWGPGRSPGSQGITVCVSAQSCPWPGLREAAARSPACPPRTVAAHSPPASSPEKAGGSFGSPGRPGRGLLSSVTRPGVLASGRQAGALRTGGERRRGPGRGSARRGPCRCWPPLTTTGWAAPRPLCF